MDNIDRHILFSLHRVEDRKLERTAFVDIPFHLRELIMRLAFPVINNAGSKEALYDNFLQYASM